MVEDNDKTIELAATVLSAPSGDARPVELLGDASFDAARYTTRRVLGAGGMGEVRLCGDAWIGRDVAMKVARPGAGGSVAQTRGRFLREARVQGQLEHPSVVPVYDIGRRDDGETFFTMKRIGGHTLEEVIIGLRENRAEICAKYNRRRLLSAMGQVCLTIAYAHSRGVIHRDLKPANVMLGDFGEVYVLDWGVAKLVGTADPEDAKGTAGPVEAGAHAVTQDGTVIGTIGYMAPEQLRGEPVTISADVYALGAMLFEVLALEPLHRVSDLQAMMASTLSRAEPPSVRAPSANIPPELDAITSRAIAIDPRARFESARALEEAIESFLDGERDAERRRELASDHVKKARAALDAAARDDEDADAKRAEGMRELGRAVALDPSNESALRAITDLVLAPSTDLPPAALAELREGERRDRARSALRASRMYIVWLGLVPLLWVMGVKSWPALATIAILMLVTSAHAQWVGAKVERAEPAQFLASMSLNFVLVGACSTIFGPFVLVPGVAASSAAAYVLAVRKRSLLRATPFAMAMLAVFVPLVLEHAGILPRSYALENGVLTIFPVAAEFRAAPTALSLVIVTFVQLALPAVLINRAVDALVDAERRSFAQAWRLRQLLP